MAGPDQASFSNQRIAALLDSLERMAGGDLQHQIEITPEQDELDAIAHGINVMAGELVFRINELQEAQGTLIQSGKLAALGEVSSGLAHELNNPLTIIRGYTEHVRDRIKHHARKPVDLDELDLYLEKLDQNVDRMSLIIRHIMEFSRQARPIKHPTSLNEVVRKSFILISEQLRLRNIHLDVQLSAEDPMTLGDDLRLEQVFLNMLTNARDAVVEAHGEAGGTIRVHSRIESNTWIRVEITDNGIGMTDEIRDKIFNPFFTTKEVGRGTGLGLSISLGIVQEHNGIIECESRYRTGTTFTIRLPRS